MDLKVKAKKLILLFLVFLLLTIAGIWFALRTYNISLEQFKELSKIPYSVWTILALIPFAIYITDVIRFRIFAKAFGTPLRTKTAFDAVIANLFFAWITPGAAMGMPAAAYILKRDGIAWESAVTVSFAKSMTGISLVLLTSLIFIFLGFGPNLENIYLTSLISVFLSITLIFIVFPVLCRLFNSHILTSIDSVLSAYENEKTIFSRVLTNLLQGFKKVIVRINFLFTSPLKMHINILLIHIIYFALFISPAVILCLYFGNNLFQSTIHSLIYATFSFVAPTPGGSGLAEATGNIFFSNILTAKNATITVLVFRFFTFYFQIFFGLIYLILFKNIKMGESFGRKK